MKMVDKKAGQKLNIVDRKFRMTPKRQRMILKKLRMTPRMTPKTELLQMIYKSLTMTQCIPMTLRMTPIIDE